MRAVHSCNSWFLNLLDLHRMLLLRLKWDVCEIGEWGFLWPYHCEDKTAVKCSTVKILKIGTPEIITIIVLHLEQLDFTVQYCVQKMQTE